MGNREALLVAAKQCLYEKGYARTTARDIATAAGVSLAAIGYHYGTKDALLHAAIYQAIEEWGDSIAAALAGAGDPATDPAERFEAAWEKVLESFAANRSLWAIQFELVAHIERTPELRQTFSQSGREARLGLADMFGDTGNERLGGLYQTLLLGAAAQWLADPEMAPSGRDLVDAMRELTAGTGVANDDTSMSE